jgi:hypothetical protein
MHESGAPTCIRHYGFLGNAVRKGNLPLIRNLLDPPTPTRERETPIEIARELPVLLAEVQVVPQPLQAVAHPFMPHATRAQGRKKTAAQPRRHRLHV